MSKKSISIDNKEYELAKLNPEARQQLTNLRVADQEIARLQVQLALAQTARNAYGQALKAELDKP